MGLPLPEASPEHIVAAVDFAVLTDGVSVAQCAALADITEDHARRALDAAEMLGLVRRTSETWNAVGFGAALIASGSRDQQRQVFRAYLEEFAPFAFVRTRLIQGFELHEACRVARSMFDIDARPAVIRDLFARWGLYAGSLVGDPPTVDTSAGLDSPLARVIDRISDDQVAAAELLSDELTPTIYVGLDESVRNNLLNATVRFARQDEPRTIVQSLGIAFEDFLRLVASESGVNVDDKTGLVQVGEALISSGAIGAKHLGFIQLIGAIRNASEHGVDQREAEGWRVTAKAAELMLLAVVSAIRSVALYNVDGRLEL